MATLTIRNLDPELVQRLKERAKRNGRSMEQEVREMLNQQLADRRELLASIRAGWKENGTPPSAEEINEWIRAGREGRQ